MEATNESSTEAPLFRAAKQRKIYRRREQSPPESSSAPVHDSPDLSQNGSIHHDMGERARVSEALRRRREAKARRGGIGFSNNEQRGGEYTTDSQDDFDTMDEGQIVRREPTDSASSQVSSRFVRQMGQVAPSDDMHMTAFIDSAMARMRQHADLKAASMPGSSHSALHDRHARRESTEGIDEPKGRSEPTPKQAASLGKIQEIDLGPDITQRNIAMTEAATQRMRNGEPIPDELPEELRRPKKLRIGHDGKPRKPRRNRRGSVDVKRDELVDALLKENRMEVDIYDPDSTKNANARDRRRNKEKKANEAESSSESEDQDDEAADERLAEEFRRDFMEALAARQQRGSNTANNATPGGPTGQAGAKAKAPKGPKLGGSRSARAAMHAKEKEKEKAGNR